MVGPISPPRRQRSRYPHLVVLRRAEKNELLELIARSGLRAEEFRIAQNDRATLIAHLSSSSSFAISKNSNPHQAVELPIRAKIGNSETRDEVLSWGSAKRAFKYWLHDVQEETDTPDLWEELRKGSALISESASPDLANTPFTVPEQEQISAQLKEIRAQVSELCSLTAEQSARMEERFDQAEEASRRLGRKDWILLFGGALLSLVVSAVVPPGVLQHVLAMTAQRLGHLFGGGPPQLPPQAS